MVKAPKNTGFTRPRSSFFKSFGRGAGFTLVETVVAMAVMVILLGGAASALMLASRAVPTNDGLFRRTVESTDVLQKLAAELLTATEFSERTNRTVTFQVHDRDGDTVPEVIRYDWSGVPGEPLYRYYNQLPSAAILNDVHVFQLSYQLEATSTEEPPAPKESNETLLIGYDSTRDLAELDVTSGRWIGQYFLPTLPADATGWKVTRIKFKARPQSSSDGALSVKLRRADASKKPSTVLEEKKVKEMDLIEDVWHDVSFSRVSGLPPTDGLCLTVEYASGSDVVGRVRYRDKNVSIVNATRLEYTGSWATYTNQAMLFRVYGTVTTQGSPTVAEVFYVNKVGVAVQVGSDSSSRVETGVMILNRPEVSGP